MEDKILHALHTLNSMLASAPTAPSDMQLAAITQLHQILGSLAKTTPPTDTPHQLPGVHGPAPQMSKPNALRKPNMAHPSPGVPLPILLATMVHDEWIMVPQCRNRIQPLQDPEPIAARTRARRNNAFALLATDNDDDFPVTKLCTTTQHLALPVLDPEMGNSLKHRQLCSHPKYKEAWDTSYANELGRLCQGIGHNPNKPTQQQVQGTDTFHPIAYTSIPPERCNEITYSGVVCKVRPQKKDPNHTHITIGGDRICYPGDTGPRTGSLALVKLQLNSVLSTPNTKFATFDISNFYLGTPLDHQRIQPHHVCS